MPSVSRKSCVRHETDDHQLKSYSNVAASTSPCGGDGGRLVLGVLLLFGGAFAPPSAVKAPPNSLRLPGPGGPGGIGGVGGGGSCGCRR